MIYTQQKKTVRVMLTTFRDGLQSVFGGKVRVADILPALEVAAEAGIRHFEFGGGARYQAPYFYAGEDPFECMDRMREAAGPEADLQILTRSVSGVTLTTQRLKTLQLQARLMKKHGTTWDRNFDYMNDVDNLIRTGRPIVEAGMHHQVCIALMGLPYKSDRVHTAEFYINIGRRLLDSDLHIDSICLKDASGTTDPRTCYETAIGLKEIMPPEMPLWMHTHDTASMAVACYMAGLAGGVDGIDLSVRPMASGTVQPDVRSMWHALKGTGYELDVDHSRIEEIEEVLADGLQEYAFNPITLAADARVVNFPMPGGAIGPNVHMMETAGILDRYTEVLAEFPVVVRAGGAWTSVTPGSQQYWLQAFNNVLHGRWQKIDSGYGRSVLGYFGRPPEPPDEEVVAIATEQLGLEPFDGDPLEQAADSLAQAEEALRERNLPLTEETLFLVASAIVPGKNMELNEGIRLLTGKARISLPLKKGPAPDNEEMESPSQKAPAAGLTSRTTTTCTVVENGTTRTFKITIEPPDAADETERAPSRKPRTDEEEKPPASSTGQEGTPVYSPFGGKVELVEIGVKVGDQVTKGQVVAAVEAMKAKHDVRAPCEGKVVAVHVALGAEIRAGQPIISIGD